MKKYNNFIKETFNLPKNVKSLLNNMGDATNVVSKVVDNIQKSANLTDAKKFLDDFFTERMKMKETVKNYESYQKILEVDLSSINVILNTMSKFGDRLKPEELYKESKNKYLQKIFSYTGEKFQGSLSENVKLLLIELGEKSGIKLEDKEEKNVNESEQQVSQNSEEVSKENVEKDTTQTSEIDTKESDEKLDKFKKIVEEFRYSGCFKPLDMKLEEIIKERE